MTEKWSTEQVNALIDAYKDEPCLYATNTPNYHNKHLRAAALERVNNAVLRLRPTATVQDCSKKFHSLRNQFNIESSKVKSSLKSGTGTDDVYRPSLWYYESLLFLETYVLSRKSRTSFNTELLRCDVLPSQGTAEENFEDTNRIASIENVAEFPTPQLSQQENLCGSSLAEQALDTNSTSSHRPMRPSPSPSPSPSQCSFSLSSGVCTLPRRTKQKPRMEDREEEVSTAINKLANSMTGPVILNPPASIPPTDSIHSFVTFLESLLRDFQNEKFRLEVMNEMSTFLITAKRADCK